MLPNFTFESFKHVIKEYDALLDFVDTQLAKVTNGASSGAWHYSFEIEADDTISISYVDRWDDGESVRLTWDELMDSSGEKYKARQVEERRKQEEESQRLKRDYDLRQLKIARELVARLEEKHPDA